MRHQILGGARVIRKSEIDPIVTLLRCLVPWCVVMVIDSSAVVWGPHREGMGQWVTRYRTLPREDSVQPAEENFAPSRPPARAPLWSNSVKHSKPRRASGPLSSVN